MNVENKITEKEPEIQTDVDITKESSQDDMGQNVNQAPQGKESDLESETSKPHGAKKAILPDISNNQVIQKEEDPKGKQNEGSHHQVPWLGHSRNYQITDRQRGRRFKPTSQWSHYLAWTLSLLLSLSCLVFSAVLGTR